MKILIPIIFILVLLFWCTQFLKLMRMKSDDFPSKEDKTIWAIAIIFLNALGALLFWIHFKPKYEEIPQLDVNLYKQIKETFPDHLKELDSALQMQSYRRHDLEKWYGRKSSSTLISEFKRGPDDIEPGCFGILLAVLTSKNIEIPNS